MARTLAAIAWVLAGCSATVVSDADANGDASVGLLTLTSSVTTDMGWLGAEYGCGGASPPLNWTTGPRGTQSYAVVMVGPTSSSVDSSYHWVIWDIQAGTTSLPAAVAEADNPPVPSGSKQISTDIDWANPGYSGPCTDFVEDYTFTVFALDVVALPGVTPASTGAAVFTAIQASAIASAKLTVMAVHYKS